MTNRAREEAKLHFSGRNAIPHFFSHAARLLRSSCRMLQSSWFFMSLYRMQLSVKSLILDWTQSGRSFMKTRNGSSSGPKLFLGALRLGPQHCLT